MQAFSKIFGKIERIFFIGKERSKKQGNFFKISYLNKNFIKKKSSFFGKNEKEVYIKKYFLFFNSMKEGEGQQHDNDSQVKQIGKKVRNLFISSDSIISSFYSLLIWGLDRKLKGRRRRKKKYLDIFLENLGLKECLISLRESLLVCLSGELKL